MSGGSVTFGPLSSKQALSKLTKMLAPRPQAAQHALLAIAEARRERESLVDNDSLTAFTQVRVTNPSGSNDGFYLEVITDRADTLGAG